MTSFLDEVTLEIHSGRGGDGVVHFRKEKHVPRGGPDGGNGGNGGDVIFTVDPRRNTLTSFRRRRIIKGHDGKRGGGNNRTGASGEDVVLLVPPGTQFREQGSDEILADLVEPGQSFTAAAGGRGGKGNARFATSRNQAPRLAEKGEPGIDKFLKLELKLLADVGIIGVPNAGKSTLLTAVTNAEPKIADYPFTTLEPNLGVAELEDEIVLVLADIPGLIEGAHEGIGLGHEFLKHIERTKVLIHLLDGTSEDPISEMRQINEELALFGEGLAELSQVVAINKTDLPEVAERLPDLLTELENENIEAFGVSALGRKGLRALLLRANEKLESAEISFPEKTLPIYRPEPDPDEFEISRDDDGSWRVSGASVERAAAMTYWEYDESVRRFQRFLERLGVEAALGEAGVKVGDTVRIDEYQLEWLE